jgi:hypothetical protein
MKRRIRPFASVLAIVALLFAQAMAAVHACDMEGPRPSVPAASTAAPDGGDCCTPANASRDPACDNHCQQANAIGDRTQDSAPMVPAITSVLSPLIVAPHAAAPPAPPPAPDLTRDTAPPISVRHCCLRI